MLRSARQVNGDTSGAFKTVINEAVAQAAEVVLGKEGQIRLAFACLLARGHLLIEDLPGLGKTTLAQVLAQVLGLGFGRIQFTSDLLPADILGVSIYESQTGRFTFHPGPVFHQVVLADEINRATPKAQSALLEAMEERQVTVEGETRALPQPFFVIATQNPHYLVGTFPLPESQLDRFMMRLVMGYPDREAERVLLTGGERRELIRHVRSVMPLERLMTMQQYVSTVHLSAALLDYVQALLDFTRQTPEYPHGLSPRAGLALVRSAQAWALMQGREHVMPEDIQAVLPGVVTHRLRGYGEDEPGTVDLVQHLIESVAIP